ncbi:hypothetical protein F6Y02_42785 [Bacillus megaterium]|nr:hypothetical protein [Priestia megaterium]
MNDEGFNFNIRTQFKFTATNHTLSYILSGIAQKELILMTILKQKLM